MDGIRLVLAAALLASVGLGCGNNPATPGADAGSGSSDAQAAAGDGGGGSADAAAGGPDASAGADGSTVTSPDAGAATVGDAGACPTLVEGKAPVAVTPGTPRPALNVPFTDPAFGLKVARVTDASQVTDRDLPTWVRHEYSRRPAFNADSTRALMISSNGWVRLYEAKADGTLAFLETLDLGEPQEPNWHPTDPNKIYSFVSYGLGFTLSSYDLATGKDTVVADLEARVKALFPNATGLWTKQEGRPSNDGRVWCLEAGHTGAGGAFVADGFVAYDLVADKLLGSMAVTDTPDHISTSPKGDYCVPSWGLPLGTRAYTTDFSKFTQLHDRSEHSDLAVTKDGDEVLVYTAYDGADAGNVVMVRLSDGQATPLFELYGANHSATSMHISGTAKDKPGYVVVGFYGCAEDYGAVDCDPKTQWFVDKVVAVELKANPKIYSLAHTHFGDAGYFAETQSVANPDLTRVLFVSSWESTDEDDVASYLVQVPACALP